MYKLGLIFSSLLLVACASHVPVNVQLSNAQARDLRDTDNDGVINSRDLCATSPDLSALDNNGCSPWTNTASRKVFTVNFDLNSAKIRPDQTGTVAIVVQEVLNSADATVALIGDTSPEGSDEQNLKLGKERADAIRELLLTAGVPESRIEEFVFNEPKVKARMDRRERRTIVMVKRPSGPQPIPSWTIYQAENAQQLAEVKGVK